MMLHFLVSRILVAVITVSLIGVAVAEEAIEEIVVTADFRGRTAGEVPASLTQLEADFIESAAVQHFEELLDFVPNLNWSGDGHRARYFQIRGVGELEQYEGAPNPSIGFLIDDIDFSGIGSIATLFDVESIEVLRGPQGSRYGANALGGLIYLKGREPSAERDGRLQLTAGSDETRALGLAFGGSLDGAGTMLFRLSLQHHESNGFRDNTYLDRDDTNGRDETAARFALAFGAGVKARLSIIFSRIDDGYDAFALDNSYTMLSDRPGKDAQESIGTSLRLDWDDIGRGQLTSITALASSDIGFGFDADWGNEDSWAPVLYDYVSLSDRQRDTISQEFRYATGAWLFGLYALGLEEKFDSLNQGEYYDPGSGWADSLDYPFGSTFKSTNVAGFTQFHVEPRDDTRFTAGLRVERRDTSYSDSDGFTARPGGTLWGGELGVSHDASGDVTVYGTLARGYKAGGFNLGNVPDEWRYFAAEAMWTLEGGVKSSLFDHAVHLNASVFHAWREDQQARASFQLVPNDPASFGFATVNIDGGRNWGAELEANWAMSPSFEVYGSAGLLLGGFPGTVEQFPWLEGREQAHAPRWSMAAGCRWDSETGWFARIDVTGQDAFYFDVSHNQESESYVLVNARFGYDNDDWRIQIWGRNLGDTRYAVRGFYFGNEPPDFLPTLYTRAGDPRHAGLTIERRFH